MVMLTYTMTTSCGQMQPITLTMRDVNNKQGDGLTGTFCIKEKKKGYNLLCNITMR